jgi:hypothetical protein
MLVPFIGGELAQTMGFPAIMRFIGFINFIYGPILLYFTMRQNLNVRSLIIEHCLILIVSFFLEFNIKKS